MIPDLELRYLAEEHRRRIAEAMTMAELRGQRRAARLRSNRLRSDQRTEVRRQLRTRLAGRLRLWADRLEPAAEQLGAELGAELGVGPIRAAEPGPVPASGRRPSLPRR